MAALIDLTGQKFGRLTVVERAENHITSGGNPFVVWLCECECGSRKTVRANDLRSNDTKSCGCLNRETHAKRLTVDTPGYVGAHRRIYRALGPASGYDCVDCGGVAAEWSYTGNDPAELTEVQRSKSGRLISVAYSLGVEHYAPRCIPCHRKFDRGR